MSSAVEDRQWTRLLQWLAGHGMDISLDNLLVERKRVPGAGYGLFARTQCKGSTRLFTVPASALLNKKTLGSTYGDSLSAVQMISLHLALHQPHLDGDSNDDLFGPYASVLPREFNSHPLTWLVKRHWNQPLSVEEQKLIDYIPPSTRASLQFMLDRFILDWNTCHQYYRESKHTHSLPGGSFFDNVNPDAFLWGWLNVNTRCIYHRLYPKQSNPDNITLCPILDFANHSTACFHMTPGDTPVRKGLSLLSPKDISVASGDELLLRYGAHSNQKLFVEYGFVDVANISKEVDIQDLLEALVNGSRLAQEIRDVLECNGYWGDWTLHTRPEPAHPSYRVISALRLIRMLSDSNTADLQPWKDTIAGLREYISDDNEAAWRESLQQVCEAVQARASVHLKVAPINADTSWASWMWDNIHVLWREEALTARMVLDSLEAGAVEA